jgi:adenylylsulfate kinase-like enzyme
MKDSYIYWFIGQPATGKTTLAKRLQFWLQTDKSNWRKTVFHLDEDSIRKSYNLNEHSEIDKMCFNVSRYIHSTGHDVVVSTTSPVRELREKFKSEYRIKEIYCHNSKNKVNVMEDYEPPVSFFVDLNTAESTDETFKKLLKVLI